MGSSKNKIRLFSAMNSVFYCQRKEKVSYSKSAGELMKW